MVAQLFDAVSELPKDALLDRFGTTLLLRNANDRFTEIDFGIGRHISIELDISFVQLLP